RSEFTDPEILRTNLASVILQMTALGLGDIAAFPFVEPPDRRQVSDGLALLHELGAIDPTASDPRKRLTEIGRKISQLPVDPRLARMVLEADRTGCATEMIVLAAALSVQDPRERPTEKQEQARAQHARFADDRSDFAAYLNLWAYLKQQQRELSGNQFRKRCRAEFLNYLRIREWQDLEAQLRHTAKDVGVTLNSTPANDASGATRIHTAVLSGLLSHIGLRDERRRDYQGARGARFSIFPGSGLFRKQPTWVMAAELVETSKLWGRICARIEPEWVEPLATHLVKRSYSEPTWSKKRASVVATERVTLYGVPIVAGRRVPYGRIDPDVSREMFIRHALVEGDWDTQHQFFHDNQALLEQAEQLEHRARRRDIVVDDDTLYDFYDARVGTEVVSGAHFDTWWKKTRRKQPDLLTFTPDMLVRDDLADATAAADAAQYPDVWNVHTDTGTLELDLTYQFEPGSAADGVTAHVPIGVLNQLPRETFDWQVPGLRSELVTAMLRSLPKPVRKQLVPAPDVAAAVLDRVGPGNGALLPVLEDTLYALRRVDVPPESWDLDKVPDHLLVTVRVEDEHGARVAEGTDLPALQRELAGQTIATISSAVAAEDSDATTSSAAIERAGMTSWSIGTLPQTSSARVNGHTVAAYPALADDGDSVSVQLTETVAVQQRTMWAGLRRLLLLTIPSPVNAVERDLPGPVKLALARPPHGDSASLLQDCLTCAVDALMSSGGAPVWDETGFTALREHVRGELGAVLADVVTEVTRILERAHTVEAEVSATTSLVLVPALTDMRTQLGELVYPGFVTATGRDRLGDIVRYLDAMSRRLEKLPHNAARAARDQDLMRTIHRVRAEYDDAVARLAPERQHDDDVRAVRWMLEELRVSFFAQSLGTRETVSEKRVLRAIDDL
ncbi:MAG TPA: ATP-dependent RNA helicase HrpA, partial [Jiangellaceae bacterium]|nr:ATP-dependent RNA helicase HrpA [Jiangellaceae bacterium]